MSKINFGSRPGYYAKDAILEKRLILDDRLAVGKHTILFDDRLTRLLWQEIS